MLMIKHRPHGKQHQPVKHILSDDVASQGMTYFLMNIELNILKRDNLLPFLIVKGIIVFLSMHWY